MGPRAALWCFHGHSMGMCIHSVPSRLAFRRWSIHVAVGLREDHLTVGTERLVQASGGEDIGEQRHELWSYSRSNLVIKLLLFFCLLFSPENVVAQGWRWGSVPMLRNPQQVVSPGGSKRAAWGPIQGAERWAAPSMGTVPGRHPTPSSIPLSRT